VKDQGRRSAPRGETPAARRTRVSRSGSWLLATSARRTRAQWRLLLGVVAVAVLASVLVTSLSLLVSATEQGGVRGALAAAPARQVAVDVRLVDPTVDFADARASVADAVGTVFAPAATTTSTGLAISNFDAVTAIGGAPPTGELPTLAYLGEYDTIGRSATLVAGDWPAAGRPAGAPLDVALPAAAAAGLGLGVGSTLAIDVGDSAVDTVVVGVYEPVDAAEGIWATDRLAGAGFDPLFPDPFSSFFKPTVTLGPLVVGEGGLAAGDIPLAYADLSFTPDFSRTTVAQVQPLLERLATADVDVPFGANGVAGAIFTDTEAATAVSAVAAGLTVTRSTVVVVSLLLVVLAVAAIAQLARLYSDARAGERQLMRARGASRRNILALALVEAFAVALVTALVTPPLASLVYRLLALQPPMVAAGMPADTGLPLSAWFISAAIALVFLVVLVAPLARDDVSFAEGTQAAGRQRLSSGLARSGIDIALVALAGVAYWQLRSYRTPVQESASLAVDPVLVAGPAIVLLAAALVCVRLIPAASRLLERLGAGARGATVALASWEIGRRSQRATAAVLLLSLTLAVGAFGVSFLSTWKQSQVDQAAFAVGAPVRVSATGPAAEGVPDTADQTAAEPTMRRQLLIGGLGGDPNEVGGDLASIMGLTSAARDYAAEGRLGELGGDTLVKALSVPVPDATTLALPADTSGIAATVRIGDPEAPPEAVAADVTAIVDDGHGHLSLLPLGRVVADGTDHEVSAGFGDTAAARAALAGLQVKLVDTSEPDFPVERGPQPVDVLVRGLAAIAGGDATSTPLDQPTDAGWYGSAAAASVLPPTSDVPEGWQFRLGVVVPPDLRSRATAYSIIGWKPNQPIPTVVDGVLAERLDIGLGDDFDVRTGTAPTRIHVVGIAPLVPGAARLDDLAGPAPLLGGRTGGLAVVDQIRLERSLVASGWAGSLVDEWRVGVSPGDAAAYLRSLPEKAVAVSSEQLAERLQQSPLRVATQAALWVAIAASTLLAAVGFGVHSAAGLRSRRLELAQLRAIGYSRRRLVGLIATESLLMSALGAVFGITIGVLLAFLVGPLVAVSPTGAPTVPSVVVEVPVAGIALLVVEVVAVLAVVVAVVARTQRFTEPASLLREGAQP